MILSKLSRSRTYSLIDVFTETQHFPYEQQERAREREREKMERWQGRGGRERESMRERETERKREREERVCYLMWLKIILVWTISMVQWSIRGNTNQREDRLWHDNGVLAIDWTPVLSLLFYLHLYHTPSSTSLPPPSVDIFFFCSVVFPQFLGRHLRTVSRENNSSPRHW